MLIGTRAAHQGADRVDELLLLIAEGAEMGADAGLLGAEGLLGDVAHCTDYRIAIGGVLRFQRGREPVNLLREGRDRSTGSQPRWKRRTPPIATR